MGKRLLIVLFLVLILTPIGFVSADPNNVEKTGITTITIEMKWNKTFGGTAVDRSWSMIQTADGGFALAGSTESYGAGLSDMWLVKTDASGQPEWDKTFGGIGNDWANSVVQTADGGFALAGGTESYGDSGRHFWLVKTDASGQAEWNNTFGGIANDNAYSVLQTADDGFALAGRTRSYGAGATDCWLIKTNALGQAEWNYTFGGISDDWVDSAIQTSDGGFVLVGATNFDVWLGKTNASGQLEWVNTFGGRIEDRISSVIQTSDGGFALAGSTESYGAGFADMWLVKTDASGQPEWNNSFGGIEPDHAYSIIQTTDGGFLLAGDTTSFGAGGLDVWLLKTSTSGQPEWNKTFGGKNNEDARSVIQTTDEGFALAGWTESYGAGGGDFWLIKAIESEDTTTTAASTSFPGLFIIFIVGVLIIIRRKREK